MWIVVKAYDLLDVSIREFENEVDALTYYKKWKNVCSRIYLAKVDKHLKH